MVVTGLEVSRMGSGFKVACRILVILGRSNSKKKTHRNACAAVTKKKKKGKKGEVQLAEHTPYVYISSF